VKDLFRTGIVYENSLGFNGGDEKSSLGLTASQLTHSGYVPNSKYTRANLAIGGSTSLDMGLNLRGNLATPVNSERWLFWGEPGKWSSFPVRKSIIPCQELGSESAFRRCQWKSLTPNGGGQFDNPRWSAKYNVATTQEKRYIAGVHADFNINKWIRFDYNLGTNISTVNRREVTEIGSRAAEGLGRLVINNYRKQEIESNLLLTLTPTINEDFSFRAVLGNNINQRTTTDLEQTGNKFIARGIYTLRNTSQQVFTEDLFERRRLIGLFGNLTFGFRDYAFIDVTGRNDWSSTLPIANRSYFYPSVSGSFIFSDALKLKSDVFDYGKVRANWAKVGRDADPYLLRNVYSLNPNFLGQPTATLPSFAYDPNLKPEFTTEVELGTQLSFFKRRVELDFTWYRRISTNLIAQMTTPPSSGFQSYNTNFGKISNQGVEVSLNVVPLRFKDFSWSVRGIFTQNKNIVEELREGVERFSQFNVLTELSPYLEAGQPFGYLRGTRSLRDEQGNLLINQATGQLINAPEQGLIGNPNPDYKMGITNTFNYKGVFLGFYLT
jgi:outer membrane receptor protein involved in Fe transport